MKSNFLGILIALLFAVALSLNIKAQEDTLYYLYSDFEVIEDQAKWSSVPSDPDIKWQYTTGGNASDPPISAASGTLNALFYEPNATVVYNRNLESPYLDLSLAKKPQLAFQHTQYSSFEQDIMYLLFKAGPGASWDTIESYLTAVDGWTQRIFNIDEEGSKYLCDSFQVAFNAVSLEWGNGICIDSVVVIENDTLPKYVHSYSYSQVDHELITSKLLQEPLIKVRIEIMGNDGPSDLKDLSFKLVEGSDNYFKSSGFRLYHTTSDNFKIKVADTSTQVGSAVSISGGDVTFSNLDHHLELGNNYIWLTADFKDTIPHNSYIEFAVPDSSLRVNDTLLPPADINEIFTDYIEEAVFYDNFDLVYWDTVNGNGDFQVDVPLGLSFGTTKDPDYAFSGTKVLGTNLTSGNGLYKTNVLPGESYHAITPSVNLKYYDRAKVYMKTWNHIYFDDSATMSISNDGGATWNQVWYNVLDNPAFIPEWTELLFDTKADKYMSRQEDVKFRISIDKTGSNTKAGFNIDQFVIAGNHLETDVGITQIMSPNDNCIGIGNDTVRAVFRNYAEADSPTNIKVFYALWGRDSTVVWDTIPGPISKDDSIVFTFTQLADFPRGDIYDKFVVGLDLPGDEDSRNDSLIKELYMQDNLTPPTEIDFEYKGGIWRPTEGSTWRCEIPSGDPPINSGSPNTWILAPDGDYVNGDTSYVTGSCFDLSQANRHIIQFKLWYSSPDTNDGFAVEYTKDDGQNWYIVDTSVYGRTWGWYTDSVAALNHLGWSGTSGGWKTVKELLPADLYPEVKVKFRMKWIADATDNGRGAAFDDFEIFPAPADIGISAITKPVDACQGINPDSVVVSIKNLGFNTILAGDTMIVGIDFESDPTVIDTFYLATDLTPGDSVIHPVYMPDMDISAAGNYDITAFTLNEDDPYFYLSNNDSLSINFDVWQNPIVVMADTIGSRQPDTVVVVPDYQNWQAGYTYLWQPGSVTDSIYDVLTHGFGDTLYRLTVTEPVHSCITKDSVNVLLLFFDVGSDSIISPLTDCEHSATELIQIQVRNFGTDSLLVDDEIAVAYQIDGGTIYNDTITLTQNFLAGKTITHTFTGGPYDFSGTGIYNIKTWANYVGGDSTATNDTVIDTRQTYGFTSLELGPDSISVKALGHTLDAGAGFVSYLWNNDSTTQSISFNTAGTYWVNAVDANGCPGQDTIYVWLKIRDVMADAMLGPPTQCERSSPASVQFRIYNNGTDTLQSGDVTVSYRINGGALVQETAGNVSDILPGSGYTHTFTAQEDLSAYQTYNFDLTATSTGDLRTSNDDASSSIQTNQDPVIDFGLDDYVVVDGATYEVDAGAGANYTYAWQDGITTTQKFTATETGDIYCTVTNSITGCTGYDEVYLQFRVIDYEVYSATLSNSPCGGDNTGTVSIYNRGTNVTQGEIFTVGYKLNNETPVEELFNIDVPSGWVPGGFQQITLSNVISISGSGANTLKIYLKDSPDALQSNDTLTMNLDISQSPVVDFGGDTLGVQFPYTLVAGSDNSNVYSWSVEGVGNVPAITITEPDNYSVTVVGSNGCITSKSVVVEHGSYINTAAQENLYVRLYPNPANNYLNVEANLKYGGQVLIELYDITNRILFSDTHKGGDTYNRKIDVDALSKGMYFIRFSNKEIYRVDKIIVR